MDRTLSSKIPLSSEIPLDRSRRASTPPVRRRTHRIVVVRSWTDAGRSSKTAVSLWMLELAAQQLRADMNHLLTLLFHQGVLDEQFLRLQQLEDETSPNFVTEVVRIYFQESEKNLRSLRALLTGMETTDYGRLEAHLNQLTGSSSSIGAKRIRNVCVSFRVALEQFNHTGCLRALMSLEREYCYLKNKLDELLHMEQQSVLAGTFIHPVQN